MARRRRQPGGVDLRRSGSHTADGPLDRVESVLRILMGLGVAVVIVIVIATAVG